jgi:hypothetical protein
MTKHLEQKVKKLNEEFVELSIEYNDNFKNESEIFLREQLEPTLKFNIFSSLSKSSKRIKFKIVLQNNNIGNPFVHGFIALKIKDNRLEFNITSSTTEKLSFESFSSQNKFLNMIEKSFGTINIEDVKSLFKEYLKYEKKISSIKNEMDLINDEINFLKHEKEIKKINIVFKTISKKEARDKFNALSEKKQMFCYHYITNEGIVFEKQELSVVKNSYGRISYYSGYDIISKKNCLEIIESELLFKDQTINNFSDIDFFDVHYKHRETVTCSFKKIIKLINPFLTQSNLNNF